jgi:phenylacetate-CoA ligase
VKPWLGRAVYAAATAVQGEYGVFRELERARSVHRMDAGMLRDRQAQRLAAVLDHALTTVPFYARHGLEAGSNPDPHKRLGQLPLLEKRVLQEEGAQLRASGYSGRTVTKSTGGSTGAPVQLVKNTDGIASEMATTWAALERYGVRLGDRSARFWGTPLTLRRRIRFRLADLAMNRIRFSAFDIDPPDLARYWERCLRFRPVWLYGYASLIHLFAEWIENAGHDGSRIGIKAVVGTSEPLNEMQRATVNRCFAAPVFDEYGCGEVGPIAYSCRLGSLHVMTDNVVLEVLDEESQPVPPGEAGEIVITDLTNYAMPLLRYRLGDRAIQGTGCECGLGFPVLQQVLGRIHDVVFTPRGRRWHGEKIDYLMSQVHGERGGFRQYQVIQRSESRLEVRLLTDEPIPDDLAATIREYVRDRLDGMEADVVRVSAIERSASGKIRVVRNDWLAESIQPHT